MMWVGLTGGIGSGKSTAAQVFSQLGVAVYTADERTKALYHTSVQLREGLKQLLGDEVYEDHIFQPAVASAVLTQQPHLWERVNALVHPVVGADFQAWAAQQSGPYVLEESAILFETGIYQRMHANILVTASEDLRIQRVLQRSAVTEAEVRSRMARQWPDAQKIPLADYVIDNNGQRSLIQQVLHIHEDLIRRAHQAS